MPIENDTPKRTPEERAVFRKERRIRRIKQQQQLLGITNYLTAPLLQDNELKEGFEADGSDATASAAAAAPALPGAGGAAAVSADGDHIAKKETHATKESEDPFLKNLKPVYKLSKKNEFYAIKLLSAVVNDSLQDVTDLIKQGVDSSQLFKERITGANGETTKTEWDALKVAIKYNKPNIAQYLLTKVNHIIHPERFGEIMEYAVNTGNLDCVKLFFDNKPRDYYGFDFHANSLLYLAAKNGHTQVASYLIETRVFHVDENRGHSKETPLMMAAAEGHKEVVTQLLAGGANINKKCTGGKTALYYATKQKHSEVVRHLVEAGANAHEPSLMKLASNNRDTETIRYLVNGGASLMSITVPKGTTHTDVLLRTQEAQREYCSFYLTISMDRVAKLLKTGMINSNFNHPDPITHCKTPLELLL